MVLRSDYLIKFFYVKLPICLTYKFNSKINTPYLKGGFVKYNLFKLKGVVTAEIERNGVVESDFTKYEFEKRNPYGFWLGAGYQFQIGKTKIFFTEIRYEATNGFTYPRPASKSKGTSLSFLVGINISR